MSQPYKITADLKGHSGRKACTMTAYGTFADMDAASDWAKKQLSRDLRFRRVRSIIIKLEGVA